MSHKQPRIVEIAGAFALALFSSPVAAQSEASPLCRAFQSAPASDGPELLYVACGAAGAVLGAADSYQLIQLPALKAAVAVTELHGSRRAWLVMRDDERSLSVEEITGTIARIAGRGASFNIDGLDLDFGPASTGQLTATIMSSKKGEAAQSAGAIDLAQLVARSRSLRAAGAAPAGK